MAMFKTNLTRASFVAAATVVAALGAGCTPLGQQNTNLKPITLPFKQADGSVVMKTCYMTVAANSNFQVGNDSEYMLDPKTLPPEVMQNCVVTATDSAHPVSGGQALTNAVTTLGGDGLLGAFSGGLIGGGSGGGRTSQGGGSTHMRGKETKETSGSGKSEQREVGKGPSSTNDSSIGNCKSSDCQVDQTINNYYGQGSSLTPRELRELYGAPAAKKLEKIYADAQRPGAKLLSTTSKIALQS